MRVKGILKQNLSAPPGDGTGKQSGVAAAEGPSHYQILGTRRGVPLGSRWFGDSGSVVGSIPSFPQRFQPGAAPLLEQTCLLVTPGQAVGGRFGWNASGIVTNFIFFGKFYTNIWAKLSTPAGKFPLPPAGAQRGAAGASRCVRSSRRGCLRELFCVPARRSRDPAGAISIPPAAPAGSRAGGWGHPCPSSCCREIPNAALAAGGGSCRGAQSAALLLLWKNAPVSPQIISGVIPGNPPWHPTVPPVPFPAASHPAPSGSRLPQVLLPQEAPRPPR